MDEINWYTRIEHTIGQAASNDLKRLENDFKRAEFLQNILIDRATGTISSENDNDYKILRYYFLNSNEYKDNLPTWVNTNRDLSQFWNYIKINFGTYASRREFIKNELSPFLNNIEAFNYSHVENNITDALLKFDTENVYSDWIKALKRKQQDPDGAITAARTMLESACKHILDSRSVEYERSMDLSELYKKTASCLKLHESQHEEKIFKAILKGCSLIINNLGNLRNNLGDAHGKGKLNPQKPASRHSELAVNLAGAMTLFLMQTYEHSNIKPQ